MVDTSRPHVVDVTRNNPKDVLYVKGNETLPQSKRFIYDPGEDIVEIQDNGVDGGANNWNISKLEVDTQSLHLGKDMSLGATTGYLETITKSALAGHQRALIPHTEFGQFGTIGSHTPQLNARHPEVFFDNPISQVTSTLHSQILNNDKPLTIDFGTWLIGTVAPVDSVQLRFYIGPVVDVTKLIFLYNYSSQSFSANTPRVIDFNDDFGFEDTGEILMEFSSPIAFSMQTDAFGNIITSFEAHNLSELFAVTSDLVLDEELNMYFDTNLDPMQLGVAPYSITLL